MLGKLFAAGKRSSARNNIEYRSSIKDTSHHRIKISSVPQSLTDTVNSTSRVYPSNGHETKTSSINISKQ